MIRNVKVGPLKFYDVWNFMTSRRYAVYEILIDNFPQELFLVLINDDWTMCKITFLV